MFGLVYKNKCLPIISRNISATLDESAAIISEVHEYVSNHDDKIESVFKFPVKESTVFDFHYKVGDNEWIKLIVTTKDKATKMYTKAVKEGNQAYLAEHSNSNVFTTKIGNLLPKEHVQIKFSYYCEQIIVDNTFNLKINITKIQPYSKRDVPTSSQPSDNPCNFTFDGTVIRADENFSVDVYENDHCELSGQTTVQIPKFTLTGHHDINIIVTPTSQINSKIIHTQINAVTLRSIHS